jgi:hypothetical protein
MICIPALPTTTEELRRKTVAAIRANMFITAWHGLEMDGIIVVLIVEAMLTIVKKV